MNTKYGVVMGRFQILHKDHIKYILAAKEKCDILVIGITSPDITNLISETVDTHRGEKLSNPLTYFNRVEMVTLSMIECGLEKDKFYVVPFPIEKPDEIKVYVPNNATYFVTIYDEWGETKLSRLTSMGFHTEVLWRTTNKGISSTEIRNLIRNGLPWSEMVPKSVFDYIVSSGLIDKIKN